MADQPLIYAAHKIASAGASGSAGTNITSAGSANTKGSWIQLTASAPHTVDGIIVQLVDYSASTRDFLVDIGIGAAASEVALINNLYCGSTPETPVYTYFLDVSIPAGTRISARSQAGAATQNCVCTVLLLARGPGSSGLQKVTTIGATTASTAGTSIDPGASANTKGAYTQLIASTVEKISALAVCIGNQAQQSRTQGRWLIDISIGAGGSEKIIIPDLVATCAVNRSILPGVVFVPVEIPSGSRIAARAASDNNTATKRLFDLILYGMAG